MAFEKIAQAQRSHILSSKSNIRCHKGALQRGKQFLSGATGGTSNNRKIKYIIGNLCQNQNLIYQGFLKNTLKYKH
jgi:hypothetical protein